MIPALLHHKLTESQENLEDLLTSTVFGLLKYVVPNEGLMKLLALASYADGTPVQGLPTQVLDIEYQFWPWMQEKGCYGAEPDVLIHLVDHERVHHVVLIEAKFRAGKSSFADSEDLAPRDQLAREWDNLVLRCQTKGWIPHIVYLTDAYGVPSNDLRESADEYRRKRPQQAAEYPLKCMWLSWRHISDVFSASKNPVLQDLNELANKYRFKFFTGFTPIAVMRTECVWIFEKAVSRYFYWPTQMACPTWRFAR